LTCLPSLHVSLKRMVGRELRFGTHSTCMTTLVSHNISYVNN
jgi:hypothetical protein